MLAELKFVAGSVSKKDFVPALRHFVIEGGTVRGYNGTLALCSPLPFDLACKPRADALVQAIANCKETVQLSITKGGRLSIRSGKFKAFVDCIEGDTPHVLPEGEVVTLDGAALLKTVKTLEPFIGTDASRPWSNGIYLTGQSAFVTNNVIVVEYWTGSNIPSPINLPRDAVKEMIRVNEAPTHAQLTANSITFHYTGERWIRTQLLANSFPDLSSIVGAECKPLPIEPKLFEGLETIKHFADKSGKVIFYEGGIKTHQDESEGAAFEIEGFTQPGVYKIEMLSLLEGVAEKIDLSTYPKPCVFFGDRLRGAIIGLRA